MAIEILDKRVFAALLSCDHNSKTAVSQCVVEQLTRRKIKDFILICITYCR